MMASDTARRRPTKSLERGTDFQLHVDGLPANVIDFTERRLMLCVERAKDEQQRMFLAALVVDYRARRAAVAWRAGRPVCIRVEPEEPISTSSRPPSA